MIKAFEQKIRLDAEQKLAKRTAERRVRQIRKQRGLSYRAGAKKSEVGVEKSSKTDLIDKDKLAWRALVINQNAIELADFIKGGADPESTDGDGWPLLHLSVGANGLKFRDPKAQHDCVKIMLKWGVNLDRKVNGFRPLNVSAAFGDAETSRLLLEAGASSGENKAVRVLEPIRGRHPLLVVMCQTIWDYGHFDVILSAFPGSARVPDAEGLTPLMRSVQMKNIALVRKILDVKKVAPDKKNNDGQTPLMVAASLQLFDICLMLVDMGASRTTQDFAGWNARQYAMTHGSHPSMVMLLDPKYKVPEHLLRRQQIDRGRRWRASHPNGYEDEDST